jgi:hypothetical protein
MGNGMSLVSSQLLFLPTFASTVVEHRDWDRMDRDGIDLQEWPSEWQSKNSQNHPKNMIIYRHGEDHIP